MSNDRLKRYVEESALAQKAFFDEGAGAVVAAGETIRQALGDGHKLLICGNGGSAAHAQHIAAEIVCRFEAERRAYPALALSANISSLTAWSNDYTFDTVFARQVEAFGAAGDVLLALSTSGNSVNVIAAVRTAREKGIRTIGLLGKDGGQLAALVDEAVVVPSARTAYVQECHQMVYHYWCEMLDADPR
jgi:D-sedoheptulose 7-phosphate isomerase